MIRAVSNTCPSSIVVAKLFQLFQPIGGDGASTRRCARNRPVAGEAAAAAAGAAASNCRRVRSILPPSPRGTLDYAATTNSHNGDERAFSRRRNGQPQRVGVAAELQLRAAEQVNALDCRAGQGIVPERLDRALCLRPVEE